MSSTADTSNPSKASVKVVEPKRVQVSASLPAGLHAELVAAAEERDLSVAYMLTAAVREFLPRLVPVEEFSLTRSSSTD